jgi:hypothetical protein
MRRLGALAAAALAAGLLAGAPVRAADPACGDVGDESGIGGTGAEPRGGDDSGIGGTGIQLKGGDEGGIGGTGIQLRGGDEGGIGGTGIQLRGGDEGGIGGTGIYGSVTRVDELCVNGLHVHLHASTGIWRNGQPASGNPLALGQVVWVRAAERDGRLYADRVDALSATVGPLTSIDAAGRRIELGRLSVRVAPGAILVDADGGPLADLAPLRVGESLDVSGFYQPDGVLAATRIERVSGTRAARYIPPPIAFLVYAADGPHQLSIEGYAQTTGAGHILVDGLDFDAGALTGDATPRTGARVWMRGEVGPGRVLRARSVTLRSVPIAPTPPAPRPAPRTPEGAAPPREPRHKLDASDLPEIFEPGARDPVRVTPGPPLEPVPIPGPRPHPVPIGKERIPPPVIDAPEPTRSIEPKRR